MAQVLQFPKAAYRVPSLPRPSYSDRYVERATVTGEIVFQAICYATMCVMILFAFMVAL